MSDVSVYSYADANGLVKYADSQGDFLFTGTWSASGTYTASPLMSAQYGAAHYLCIRDNVGDNPQRPPTRLRPQSWSILSLLYAYQADSAAPVGAVEVVGVGSTAYAGTFYADFTGAGYQQMTVNGPLALNGTRYRTGAEITVILRSDGTAHPLYMAGSISNATWFGTTPPSQIYDRDLLFTLTCLSASPVALTGAPKTEA